MASKVHPEDSVDPKSEDIPAIPSEEDIASIARHLSDQLVTLTNAQTEDHQHRGSFAVAQVSDADVTAHRKSRFSQKSSGVVVTKK